MGRKAERLTRPHGQIAVDPPLRQGQTKYPFLVMQFPIDEEVDLTLNMDEWVAGLAAREGA